MAKKSISKSFSNIMNDSSIISNRIKENAVTIGRYGIDVPTFSANLEADLAMAAELFASQQRIISQQKSITLELNDVLARIEKQYTLCKKTVKLAEPQEKWVGYGIADKK